MKKIFNIGGAKKLLALIGTPKPVPTGPFSNTKPESHEDAMKRISKELEEMKRAGLVKLTKKELQELKRKKV
jgi:hypothetical protein